MTQTAHSAPVQAAVSAAPVIEAPPAGAATEARSMAAFRTGTGLAHAHRPIDTVRDTQATFRVLLDALARPGQVRQLPVAPPGAPGNPWAITALLTLLDHETLLCALPDLASRVEVVRYLCSRTSSRTTTVGEADFAIGHGTGDSSLVTALKRGELAYPDTAATLILTVDGIESKAVPAERATENDAITLSLSGPGVTSDQQLHVRGISHEMVAARNEATHEYPLGIDMYLIDAEGRVVGLPRSTRITEDN